MKSTILHIALFVIVATIFGYSCKLNTDESQKQPVLIEEEVSVEEGDIVVLSREQYESAGMQMGALQLETLNETINTTGFLNVPQENQIIVSSYMGGYASSTTLLPGDVVEKGQLLLQLTNPEIVAIQKDYLVAKQNLTYLKTVYDRQVTLERERISSKDKLLLAKSEYENMLATKAALEQTLQLNNIRPDNVSAKTITPVISLFAPIGGVITSMEAENGQLVSPGEPLFKIVNTDHMHLEMRVFEQDVALVHAGQKVRFSIPDSRFNEFFGEVFLVGKFIDRQERTVTIHAHPDESGLLPHFYGMFVEAEIIIADREANCVPISALASGSGYSYVFVEKSETDSMFTFERIPVEVGFITETYAEIKPSSLPSLMGKRILITGAYGLMQE